MRGHETIALTAVALFGIAVWICSYLHGSHSNGHLMCHLLSGLAISSMKVADLELHELRSCCCEHFVSEHYGVIAFGWIFL